MVLYIIIAPYLFKIFFPKYLDAIPYSIAYIFTFISFPSSLMGTAFQAKMMKKELYLLRIIALSRIILYITLIPFYGIWGLIIAKIGAEVVSLVSISFLFRRF